MKILQTLQDLKSEMLGDFLFEFPIVAEAAANSSSRNILKKANEFEIFLERK